MKNFDRLLVPGCEEAVERQNALNQCAGRDPRCNDPAFAQANPGICGIDPRCVGSAFAEAHPEICGPSTSELVLKPSTTVLCKDKSVQLHTFIRQGTNETEVSSGVIYRSSNQSIALVGAIGGNVTGVAEGIATISAEWLGKTAYAQIQVMPTADCCGDISNRIVIVTDVSKSMSVAFGGTYATKLAFAKAAAVKFVNGVDLTKDQVALYSFAEAVTQVRDFSTDRTDLLNAIASLTTLDQETNVLVGLDEAIQAANEAEVPGSRKIIVLISDFENKLGEDPTPLAQTFFESGGIIIVVGVRANGAGYVLGNKLASGGFFINGYPAVATDALSSLDGVKAYFCSGACIPAGDAYASRAQLNFSPLTNWDVPRGLIDLIGAGSDGVALYDLVPGHGLYLDLAGSGPTFPATIVTKQTFTFEPGIEYRLTVRLAGNQRSETATGTVFITVGDVIVDSEVTREWSQNFTDEIFTFTVDATTTGTISIRYEEDESNSPYGYLLDLVLLENVTGGNTIFSDDFDNENLQYIPPGCGEGTVILPGGEYAVGYNCEYTDCLNIPPGTQQPDPIIAPDIEVESPPTIYTATKSATATCPVGTTGASVTKIATATSIVSQADANAKATAAAALLAEAALVCTRAVGTGDIISIAFQDTPADKVGFAAIGSSSTDFWNSASFDADKLRHVDGVLSGAKMVIEASWGEAANLTHPDKLMQTYARGFDLAAPGGPPRAFNPKIAGLPIGQYDIYVYAHGPNNNENATFQAQVGAYNEGTGVFTAETSYDVKTTENGAAWNAATWVEGNQYVKFSIVIGTAGKWVELLQAVGADGNYVINGIQIKRTGGGPDAGVIPIGAHPSLPYPSTKFVEGRVGKITKVVLNLPLYSHGYPTDVDMLLVGPDGTHVMIMSDAGGTISTPMVNVNLVFDDAVGAPDIPALGPVASGTYHTKDYAVIAAFEMPSPAPPGSSPDLTAFNGKNPNGAWKLYVSDDAPGTDSGTVTNWTLTITTDEVIPPTDADLELIVGHSPDPVSQNAVETYTVKIKNNGPNNASAVTLIGHIPIPAQWFSYAGPGVYSGTGNDFSVNVGIINAGAEVNVVLQAKVNTALGTLSANFGVSATQTDLNTANNNPTVNVTVVP